MKIKSWMWVACLLLCVSVLADAQMVKVEGGVAFSKLKSKGMVGGIQYYDKSIVPFQMSVGLEYLDRDRYNLSSSIGFYRAGGRMDIPYYTEESTGASQANGKIIVRDYANYITINTVFNIKHSVRRATYYIGVGPRIDIGLSTSESIKGMSEKDEAAMEKPDWDMKPVIGLKCVAGFWYSLDEHFRLGASFSYLPSFTKTWASPIDSGFKFYNRSFTLGAAVGYVL